MDRASGSELIAEISELQMPPFAPFKKVYSFYMTKLLDQALEIARGLPPEAQDEIARIVLSLVRSGEPPVALSFEERSALARSKTAAARGEFASDEQVRAVWSKHGL